ncbi:MAG: hypothetical protein WDM86_08620 [Rhizomicrobium sp.]
MSVVLAWLKNAGLSAAVGAVVFVITVLVVFFVQKYFHISSSPKLEAGVSFIVAVPIAALSIWRARLRHPPQDRP